MAADEAADQADTINAAPAFWGFMGATIALGVSNLGAAYGTAKSGSGISTMGVLKPDLIMKSIVPVVMAGILGIYGLIISVVLLQKLTGAEPIGVAQGYKYLASGICCGFSSLAAGLAIGIVGDAGVRFNAQQPQLFVGLILMLIFGEALGLFGMIVGIILAGN